MTAKTCFLACAAVGLAYTITTPTVYAQCCVHGGACCKGLAVGCAPNRQTFGYTPTHWRPWPTVTPTVAAPTLMPAAEAVPTPAEESPAPEVEQPAPSEQPDELKLTPEETIPFPTESAPTAPETEIVPPKPSMEPETFLPFQDQPPAPPTEPSPESPGESGAPGLPSPSTDTSAKGAPASESQTPGPPLDDAPPTMPDDDPFRDDPVQPGSEPARPDVPTSDAQPRGPILSISTNGALRPRGVQWRSASDVEAGGSQASASKSSVAGAASSRSKNSPLAAGPNTAASGAGRVSRVAAGSEPGLLRTRVERTEKPARPAMLPATTPAHRNPLRLAASVPRSEQRVVAAGWSASPPAAAAVRGSRRRNPLRDN